MSSTEKVHRHLNLISLGAVCLVILALGRTDLLSRGLANVGWLASARHLQAPTDPPDPPDWLRPERLFRQAALQNPKNVLAYRGLGLALAMRDRDDQAVAAWRAAGNVTSELIQRSEQARRAERWDEALAWCQRAIALEPNFGDPWYCMGLAYAGTAQWVQAERAYERALQAEALAHVGRSSPHYRLGSIYLRHFEPTQLDAALRAYNTALALQDFTTELEAADAYHGRGVIYSRQGRPPRDSISEYQKALDLNPKHRWAHVRLAEALFEEHGEVGLAEDMIEQALALWPNDESRKWPYRVLGNIYIDAGLTDQAIAAYQEALHIDPDDEWVERALRALDEALED